MKGDRRCFKPGQSGNPAGRPRGSRNRRTVAAEKLFDENAERLTQLAIELANKGDTAALRLCTDRICPRAKHSPVAFQLPPIATATAAIKTMSSIVQGVSDGDLTALEAAELSMLLRVFPNLLGKRDRGTHPESWRKPRSRCRRRRRSDAAPSYSAAPRREPEVYAAGGPKRSRLMTAENEKDRIRAVLVVSKVAGWRYRARWIGTSSHCFRPTVKQPVLFWPKSRLTLPLVSKRLVANLLQR
jgi:Family of unknown function (DUF5681)